MARATTILAITTALGVATSAYLYTENRSLRAAHTPPAPAETIAATTAPTDVTGSGSARSGRIPTIVPTKQPELPDEPKESRMERRARRTEEFAAMFGRHDGETEEQYKARITPMIAAGLALPRMKATENRRLAEEKAGVTPAQSKQLDALFDKTYADSLDYVNKAIADGTLSPYERNVAGWLEVAGGMGGILGDTQAQIGKVISPEQQKAMAGMGFEWAEYLGLSAPWEKLSAPPPR